MKTNIIFLTLLQQLITFATCQQCTVNLSALQCERNEPTTIPLQPSTGIPGKRGPAGPKGVKGEPGMGSNNQVQSDLSEKLVSMESNLNATKALVEILKTRLDTQQRYNNQQSNNLPGAASDIPRSCTEVSAKHQLNGVYKIQPNQHVEPFDVLCYFDSNQVRTSVNHDSEYEIQVSPECDPSRCYKRRIVYAASIPQIRALINLVGNCRQFVKYRCIGSAMFRWDLAGWESWDGRLQKYWGGGDQARDRHCSCGIRGDCRGGHKCNCDDNLESSEEEVDSGYISRLSDLPVTSLMFGDTGGGDEHGYHTLGKLECFG